MARKLIDQNEAARMLGVSVDELTEIRDRYKLSAYRDGGTTKFNVEQVEQVIAERKAGGGDSDDSILLSERELGASGPTTSSTIIGKQKPKGSGIDDDIQLAAPVPPTAGSDVSLVPDLRPGSDVKLMPSGSNVLGSSDILVGSGTKFDDLDLDLTGSSKKGLGSDALSLKTEDDDLLLADDLTVTESGSKPGSKPKHQGGSSIKLSHDDDDDLVLGGASDITRSAGDSGISLGNPADSGISLDKPLDLGGSHVEAFELGEDDVISLEADTDLEGATQLKADDDFLLTPVDDAGGKDDSDSGSQVIALDTDDDMGAAGMFGSSSPGMARMLTEDRADDDEDNAGSVTLAGAKTLPAGALAAYPQVPEAPFSIWTILGLLACTVLLTFTGMMMYDLVRNMWSWDQPVAINSSLMNQMAETFGWVGK